MKLAHQAVTVPLTEPFASGKGVVAEVRQRLVRLSWAGLTGFGTSVSADAASLDACGPLLAGASPFTLAKTLAGMEAAGIGPATVAAVDMAMHDLLGRSVGLPLHQVLGLAGLPLAPTALSIGACSDRELLSRGRLLTEWPILKLKLTPADDGRRVAVLREVYGGRIWVDGNGSWDPRRAVAIAEELHRLGVELLEQPIRPGAAHLLRFVRERSPVPIVADEDCSGPADVLRLRGCADAVNIKPSGCGGLRRAREMVTLARHAGLKVMLGCKTESALGVTATAQLGGLADYLDLDGHLDLLDDPFTGIGIDRGEVTLPDRPGLGVTVRHRSHRGK